MLFCSLILGMELSDYKRAQAIVSRLNQHRWLATRERYIADLVICNTRPITASYLDDS